ncbi:hypothetical protein [Enterovirga rhinocerotis]|uniref:Uncharacterized protein n=1 Tax=Enterovirga rhinocerotis TaxID=1339210 RepID=A0A4R7C1E0_9HYPH|nr:hypothetical protein [Enterovirga rhinocerotis]TDR90317.1 hypothetical protein EV668_3165 [Enterovirga rhinocerotis]
MIVPLERLNALALKERLEEIGWSLSALRREQQEIVEAIRQTHPDLPAPNLTADAKAARIPLYAQLDDCNARIHPLKEEAAAIRRELAQRPDEERDAA